MVSSPISPKESPGSRVARVDSSTVQQNIRAQLPFSRKYIASAGSPGRAKTVNGLTSTGSRYLKIESSSLSSAIASIFTRRKDAAETRGTVLIAGVLPEGFFWNSAFSSGSPFAGVHTFEFSEKTTCQAARAPALSN